jgi:23S rRNA pseudouridine2605 synthase
MRLHVFLAKAGIASRRACEGYIREGRVLVNGERVTAMGVPVGEHDIVTFDDQPVTPLEKSVYLALHKPVQVLCTQYDEAGRKKAIELIPPHLHKGLFHAGRLDFMSSGLVFYTNDGTFAAIVTHPSFGIEKEYLLETVTDIPVAMLPEYVKGIRLEGELLKIIKYRLAGKRRAKITLNQGKNREIRRVCQAFHVPVKQLVRIRIGKVLLEGIEPGNYRTLTKDEVGWFLAQGKHPGKKSGKELF